MTENRTSLQACKLTVIIGNVLGDPIRSQRIILGLMYIETNNVYPNHAHASKETYCIIAGKYWMKKGNQDFDEKRGSDIIIHEPHEIHALKTMNEPVLVVWVQTGDIHGEYYFT